jgi:hypothetical protein
MLFDPPLLGKRAGDPGGEQKSSSSRGIIFVACIQLSTREDEMLIWRGVQCTMSSCSDGQHLCYGGGQDENRGLILDVLFPDNACVKMKLGH